MAFKNVEAVFVFIFIYNPSTKAKLYSCNAQQCSEHTENGAVDLEVCPPRNSSYVQTTHYIYHVITMSTCNNTKVVSSLWILNLEIIYLLSFKLCTCNYPVG